MQLDRLNSILDWPTADLTVGEASDLLALDRRTIGAWIQTGRIEASWIGGRGTGHKMHYRISKAALIKWLWDNTTSDRSMMRAVLETRAPKLLAVLDRLSTAATAPAPTPEAASGRRRRAAAPAAPVWHPDQLALFQDEA